MDTLIISPMAKIKNDNLKIVHTKENPYIPEYEKFHADLQVCVIGSEIIVPPMFYNYYKKMLKGKNVICGEINPDGHYPKCCAYNVAVTKKYAVCNEKITDRIILQRVKKLGLEIINVKQGYAKCSMCIAKDAVITSDMGIYKAIHQKINTLLISSGQIFLPGYEYGFIGGASGFDGESLNFTGDITKHPDFLRIDKFLKDNNIIYTYTQGNLFDCGSAFYI